MRVHGGQEAITKHGGPGEDVLASIAFPVGLQRAHEGDEIRGRLGMGEEVDLVRGREVVVEAFPGLGQFVVFDVEFCRGRTVLLDTMQNYTSCIVAHQTGLVPNRLSQTDSGETIARQSVSVA